MTPEISQNAAPARRGAALLTLALALALAPSGCNAPPAPGRAPVLLVTVDTFPAFRVGCYGAPDVRTPGLDRMARRGIQVWDAVAPVPLTLPTHATLLTGLDPPAHGVRENGLFVLEPARETIAELLPAGTPSAGFVGAFPVTRRFGIDQGFDHWDETFPPRAGANARHLPMRRARAVFDSAAAWLARTDATRPFAWTHVFDPHYPYDAPRPWSRAGGGSFEGEVAYTDHELRRFLRTLEAAGDRCLVVLTADHGESLGRHGELTHGLFVYDATQRVPLVVAGPGIEPRLDAGPRPLRDVAATLLDAYGVAAPSTTVPLQETAPPRPAYVETKHTELLRGWSALYGLRTERWKYVRAPRPELYDILADPGETENVLAANPGTAARLAALLDERLAEDVDAAAVPMSDETAEKLQALGYLATSEPGAPDAAGKDPKDYVEAAAALFRGQEAYLEADFRRAEVQLSRAARLDPEGKEAHSFLAGTFYGLGRYELAVESARRSLELPPHRNEAPVYTTLGEALLALGRAEDAVAPLEEAVRLRPRDPKARQLLDVARGGSR